jgi:ribosomal protein S27E
MKAKGQWACFELTCPKCGEAVAEPSTGSHLWNIHEQNAAQVTCLCGEVLDVPKGFKTKGAA